jgi:hypothetical protein
VKFDSLSPLGDEQLTPVVAALRQCVYDLSALHAAIYVAHRNAKTEELNQPRDKRTAHPKRIRMSPKGKSTATAAVTTIAKLPYSFTVTTLLADDTRHTFSIAKPYLTCRYGFNRGG